MREAATSSNGVAQAPVAEQALMLRTQGVPRWQEVL